MEFGKIDAGLVLAGEEEIALGVFVFGVEGNCNPQVGKRIFDIASQSKAAAETDEVFCEIGLQFEGVSMAINGLRKSTLIRKEITEVDPTGGITGIERQAFLVSLFGPMAIAEFLKNDTEVV